MCGLFGMIRQPETTPFSNEVLYWLGDAAVERGRDSAGIAYVKNNGDTYTHTGPGLFLNVFDGFDHQTHAEQATVLLGHTRAASQGSTTDPANFSPLAVHNLTATHNGDVEVRSIPGLDALPSPRGGTDTERLFQAIAAEASIEGVAKVLSLVKGRAALAWTDQTQPEYLFLARAALSPLATAFDRAGNFYWASNPNWFRDLDTTFKGLIGFHNITLYDEGTLAVIDTATREPVHTEHFTPQCRASDVRSMSYIAHRGFTPEDASQDKSGFKHVVAGEEKSLWPTFEPVDRWGSEDEELDDYGLETLACMFVEDWVTDGQPVSTYIELTSAHTKDEIERWCDEHGTVPELVPYIKYEMEEWLGQTDSTF